MKNQRIILMSLIAGFIIVILVAVLGMMLNKKPLYLYNLDQVESNLNNNQIGELENFIWESLKRTQGFNSDTKEIIVLVRPSSFSKFTKDEITNYNFIIDVDEFKATYEVSFALMRGEGFYESPIIDCPTPDLMKYPGTKCKGEKTSTLTVTMGRYLPYYFNLDTGELVTVMRGTTETADEILNVKVSSCNNERVKVAARQKVEEWIESLSLKPADYKIVIPEYCDGEF